MPDKTGYRTMLDGHDATELDLSPLAFSGFAHFTAMQIRNGAVRGLDLHLERLREASKSLFGQAHSDDEVREILRAAVAEGPSDLSLTATVFSRSGEFRPAGSGKDLGLLVRTAPPANGPDGPLRLDVVRHDRQMAEIKHVGEGSKTYYLRRAISNGFDDAAYIDAERCLSEATIWNLAFWDGESVIWPEAAILRGVTMQILTRQLSAGGVSQKQVRVALESVRNFEAGVVMNSWTPGIAIAAIGSTPMDRESSFLRLLQKAYEQEPAIPI